MPSPPSILGYCTNVHAGATLDSVLENLQVHAVAVREQLGVPHLGVGLWFSETAAEEVCRDGGVERVRDALATMRLVPYTFNGFPQGNFHTSVVKHRVYLPEWWDPRRAEYTRQLIRILDRLLPPGMPGSISTLPIAWGEPSPSRESLVAAAAELTRIAIELQQLESDTGRRIVLALEPEPGCVFTDGASLRRYFDTYLSPPALSHAHADAVRQHLTVCHDICHSAVMWEDQADEIRAYADQGIGIGKVQVSSAISVPWDRFDAAQHEAAHQQLSLFAEDRYLHQTTYRTPDGELRLVEDLPLALRDRSLQRGEWRIHFHVPIYVEAWGHLRSTRGQIERWLDLWNTDTPGLTAATHVEVETYAWGVLPPGLRTDTLHQGIANELQWLRSQWPTETTLSPWNGTP
jgi:sugar phosphate isomerase/epimerase